MITGAALLALGGMAHAADATSDSAMSTASTGAGHVSAAAPIQTLTASTDASASSGSAVTEIVVTGSRIPQPNLTSVSPIQAVGHQDFQLAGHTDVIDLLNTLPQNFQNSTTDFSNTTNPLTSPGGITTADLRGLGPQRTLVLVNGRRLGIGDPDTGNPNPAPDLDQIPVALIDHVEVLTGGASATYGSDAIAGVVNFVMKKDFEGVQVDGQYGIDQHTQQNTFMQSLETQAGIKPPGDRWDGQNTDFSVIFGANAPDGKGNVTGYFEFKHEDPVTEGDRDFSNCLYASSVVAPLLGLNGPVCAGSSSSNKFTVKSGPNLGAVLTNAGTSLLPFPQAGTSPPAAFNSSPYEYLSRDDTRYLGGFLAHYEIAPWAQPYAEFSFMSDRTTSDIAPSGAFQGQYTTNCGNPLLSAQESGALGCTAAQIAATNQTDPANQINLLIGRRNIEGGPRIADFEHENYRVVIGMKGDFADDAWHYDAYGSYYYTSLFDSQSNYQSLANQQNALLVGGTAAAPTCLSAAAVAAGCVPWNIFATGGVTPAQTSYLSTLGTSHGTTEEQIFEANVTGDLGKYGVKLPWAEDGIGISVGTQHRWDRLTYAPDVAELSGDLAGFSGAAVAVDNAITVQEEYGEARIPIAQKQPFAYDLYIEGGIRYSDYSTSGGTTTYKFGGQWSPVPDFTLRGSYDRAIRAASILEAFSPDTVTNSTAFADTCAAAPGVAAASTFAQCARTGVTAAQYGNGIGAGAGGGTNLISQCPAAQCATLEGGNPNLKPEVSNSYSIGAVFRPSFLKGFQASIDYWDIQIQGEIGIVPLSTSYSNCLNGIDTATFCPNVVRDNNGGLFGTTIAGGGYVIGTNQNIAATDTSGIDFQGDYRLALEDVGVQGMGSVSFHFNGTYQVSNKTQTLPGQPTYDCAGLFGPTCATVDPKWRHIFSVTWNTPWNILARLQWRYIGETTLDNNSTQPGLFEGFLGEVDNVDGKLPAMNYLDLSGAWRVNQTLTLRAGVNNILDSDPPLMDQTIAGTGAPNTYPTYDLLGRELFFSATAKF
jgi:iron complex outermembrane recepter protein